MYTVDDVRERVVAVLDQLLMKWISKEGKDMFNLQANAYDIAAGIKEDLDMQMIKIGLTITDFNISSFSYPEEVQKMQNKAASQSMVGDMNKYAQMAMADNMSNGKSSNIGVDMMNMQMGLQMGRQMMDSMNSMNRVQVRHKAVRQAVHRSSVRSVVHRQTVQNSVPTADIN